jgi:hypothetical protein
MKCIVFMCHYKAVGGGRYCAEHRTDKITRPFRENYEEARERMYDPERREHDYQKDTTQM